MSEGVRKKDCEVLATHMFLSSKYAVHCGNILRCRVSRRHDNLKMKVVQLKSAQSHHGHSTRLTSNLEFNFVPNGASLQHL